METSETKIITGIVTHTEIEEQEQINELDKAFAMGYRKFFPLGAGLFLLTKETIKIPYETGQEIVAGYRRSKFNEAKFSVTMGEGEESTILQLYLHKITD